LDSLFNRPGGSISEDEIAYGDASGDITSDTGLTRTTNGIKIGNMKVEEGAGFFSIVHGNTAAASVGVGWVAQGTQAGQNNTTGNNWVAQGFQAGFSNTTGSNWVAQGALAGQNNTTGSFWVAQGYEAGRNSTTGGNWVAQGHEAGFSNTTGNNWVAQGYLAGYSNITGSNWVAQGYRAGENNTTGNNWVAQGNLAGENNTTGSFWVAQGNQAGGNNTTGSNWVAQGNQAATLITGGTTNANFDNGVYIGASTKVGEQDATNEIVIGYQAEGNGSYTATIGNDSTISFHAGGYSFNVDQDTTGLGGYLLGLNEVSGEIELQAGGTDDQTSSEVPYTNNGQSDVGGALDSLFSQKTFLTIDGGSTNTAAGVLEVIDNDTPGTVTVAKTTADFGNSGTSTVTYSGTSRTFKITATISGATTTAADAVYYILKDGVAVGPGVARDHSNDNSGSVVVSVVTTLTSTDTVEVGLETVAAETFNIHGVTLEIEEW